MRIDPNDLLIQHIERQITWAKEAIVKQVSPREG